jgi:hypothetical protein
MKLMAHMRRQKMRIELCCLEFTRTGTNIGGRKAKYVLSLSSPPPVSNSIHNSQNRHIITAIRSNKGFFSKQKEQNASLFAHFADNIRQLHVSSDGIFLATHIRWPSIRQFFQFTDDNLVHGPEKNVHGQEAKTPTGQATNTRKPS